MAILLERPPTKPQPIEERSAVTPIVAARDVEATSLEHWWRHLSLHDQVAALMLAIGEYGALAHGAVGAALLRFLTVRGKHAELPEAHRVLHSS
jgi:hypothetical protein